MTVLGNTAGRLTLVVGTGRFIELKDDIAEVFVGDPEVVTVTPMSSKLLYLFANTVGNTEVQFLNIRGTLTAALELNVALDELALAGELRKDAPLANVDVRATGNRVDIVGEVATIDQAQGVDRFSQRQFQEGRSVANQTQLTGANQINLRVRIGEIDRNEVTRLGLNWRGLLDSSSVQFGFGSGIPITTGVAAGAAALNLDLGEFGLDAVVDLLKRENAIKILAEPNLTVLNGKRARFLAGGEIPVPIRSGSLEGTSVIFKSFGVSLDFKPTLLSGNRIQLEVRPEVSSIAQSDFNFAVDGLSLPTFKIRRADTTVEMASGQTLAIAGLFEQQEVNIIRKIPVLGDLPILGALFRSEEFQRNETELIILITPYLVKPSDTPLTGAYIANTNQ